MNRFILRYFIIAIHQDFMLGFVDLNVYLRRQIPFQSAFAYLGYKKGDFPVSEKLSDEMLAIPLFPEITREEQNYVIAAVMEALK